MSSNFIKKNCLQKLQAAEKWNWWDRLVGENTEMIGSDESVMYLGSRCKARSYLYHQLLHYKYRLLLKVTQFFLYDMI